ncbi:hypothetical protein PENSPDRAFT_651434 [Peniophora sp. CONT]|nr:hypothetical protein PENSPDRAFT_651434 [Peniophora sp. CONT]
MSVNGSKLKKATSTAEGTPLPPSLGEKLSYAQAPRPFKNPQYTKNNGRRAKNVKAVLAQERERARAAAERMAVDGEEPDPDPLNYLSIEAPPSLIPARHYCDITGLEALYTDPATGLRYHDKSVYEFIKTLPASAAREYLAARGVNPVVK